jgi:hypothetical protein
LKRSPFCSSATLVSSNDDGTGTFGQLTLERFRLVEPFKGLPDNATEVWVDPGSGTSCYGSIRLGNGT